jgi:hypothetical protein
MDMLKTIDLPMFTRILTAATPKRLLALLAASLTALGPNVAPLYAQDSPTTTPIKHLAGVYSESGAQLGNGVFL